VNLKSRIAVALSEFIRQPNSLRLMREMLNTDSEDFRRAFADMLAANAACIVIAEVTGEKTKG